MTREDILAMPAGRELDALVAKTLFNGQTITKKSSLSDKTFYALVGGEQEGYEPLEKGRTLRTVWWRHTEEEAWQACPYYSADISAAWEVVEKFHEVAVKRFETMKGHRYWCKIEITYEGEPVIEQADTAPEAICKAALLAQLEEQSHDL